MLERFFEGPKVLERLRASGAAGHIDGFGAALAETGYAQLTGRRYLHAAAHLGNWCRLQSVDVHEIDDAFVYRFGAHLPSCACADSNRGLHADTYAGAQRFLQYLRRAGVVSAAPQDMPQLPPVVEEFRTWMRAHRGIAESTLANYVRLVVEFVGAVGADPSRYDVASVRGFVLERARRHSPSRAQTVVAAVRMFLRSLAARGHCCSELVEAVPSVAHWRLATLPRYLPSEAVNRIIASCDPRSPMGARDRAILLLLARLGLRAGDVAALRLGDLDWPQGRLLVSGKGRCEAWLPLPQEVGDAVLWYLERSRPPVVDDHVFLRAHAPRRPFRGGSSVSHLVGRIIRHAGIQAPSHGAHVLRHSLATQMLREGSSLEAIGVLLRHRALETTDIYAKVDVVSLRLVAQPWPDQEGAPC